MSLLKSLFLGGSSVLPIKTLQALSPTSLYLPYHHLVSNEKVAHIAHLYPFKNEKQFNKDLDYLLKYFSPIEIPEILNCIKENRPFPKNSFLITFDDGLSEIYNVVAPILEKKGIPAIFFINNAYVDNKKLFYRFKISLLIDELIKNANSNSVIKVYAAALNSNSLKPENIIERLKDVQQSDEATLDQIANQIGFSFENYLQTIQPFLTSLQIKALLDKGFYIGGHSVSHPYYPSLSLDGQLQETLESLQLLNERFEIKNRLFAFPHSDKEITQSFFEKIKNEEVELFFGIQNQKKETKNRVLHRFNAERPHIPLQQQIKSVMVYNWVMNLLGRDNVLRKP